MELMMSSAGGTYGTIAKTAFQSQLTSYFKRFTFSEQCAHAARDRRAD